MHYLRWQRHGDPTRERPSLTDRLTRRVRPSGECVVWAGARDSHGYGVIKVRGKMCRASRVVWELAHGPIPTDLVIRHHCDNPPCIRLDHLEVGTHRQNVQDALLRGRRPQNERKAA